LQQSTGNWQRTPGEVVDTQKLMTFWAEQQQCEANYLFCAYAMIIKRRERQTKNRGREKRAEKMAKI